MQHTGSPLIIVRGHIRIEEREREGESERAERERENKVCIHVRPSSKHHITS